MSLRDPRLINRVTLYRILDLLVEKKTGRSASVRATVPTARVGFGDPAFSASSFLLQ